MKHTLLGIHHITAIAGQPQLNLDFFTQVMGLRLVKCTVNFDDAGTYHFYYGNAKAQPGTILTFFPRPYDRNGSMGFGVTAAATFAIPDGTINYWLNRFKKFSVRVDPVQTRFDRNVLPFYGPDGLFLELIEETPSSTEDTWGGIPAQYAISGFHSATLNVGSDVTEKFLQDYLGFRLVGQDKSVSRWSLDHDSSGSIIDIKHLPNLNSGTVGIGSIHHIAFRVSDDETQFFFREKVAPVASVTHQIDRKYFRSIYFREPSGVLFEIATDDPGFDVDEPFDQLGSSLLLPEWFEQDRAEIESRLPKIKIPKNRY